MTRKRKPLLFALVLFLPFYSIAQIEVSHLTSKGFSATGFGAFLNLAVPIAEGEAITGEAGFYYFTLNGNSMALVPFLIGYRRILSGNNFGLYIEPDAGYTIGATDIQKSDAFGSPIPNGNGGWVDQQAKGFTAGMGFGYIFPGRLLFNVGLRYQHVFVSGDPALNMFSLRLSFPFSFGKRDE